MTRLIFLLCSFIFLLPAATGIAQPSTPVPADLDALPACSLPSSDLPNLQVGAVILDLYSGVGCTQNLDTPMPVASVPKLFIAGAFLLEVARGNLSFEQTMIFSEDYFMGGRNACMTEDLIGAEVTYGYLSDIMISCSDNSATWMLMDALGWQNVQMYVDSLGIPGIGRIVPYAFVDRAKLALIDERWAEVPAGLAARFYRTRDTRGLVPTYFPSAPNYTREQRIEANNLYFQTYNYNTATPRAIVQYILKLRDDLYTFNAAESQAAFWLFNTMILTQRQFSAQALPGTVYVGAKNGFDMGLRAEVNVMFPVLWTLDPAAIALVFAYQETSSGADFDEFGPQLSSALTDYLLTVSPAIAALLYPNDFPPVVARSNTLSTIVFNRETWIENCVQQSATLLDIELCWQNLSQNRLTVGEQLGMGVILRNMAGQTQRFSLIYTAPDGRRFSYQYTVAERDETFLFWYHVPDVGGVWQVDFYQNLQRVYSGSVLVEG